MFLDRAVRPGESPAVVRSYASCQPVAAARDSLAAARNASRAARAALAASPLPVLAIIYFGTHLERLAALRAYEHYFWRVVYMSPSAAIGGALERSPAPATRGAGVRAPARAYHCRRSVKTTYACVVDAASALGSRSSGVLYFQL